ncbi:capsular biosynthesis protein [Agathobacter ruminis]|uniref:Capsular biosynthesis protein n=2 Tax=Agathobacter ruminis TaxID=1712665 RepID=A0A2G3E2R0_9FIRM|nr:capsular biosynthesis protein [Agathobacter ruminis]
MCIIEDMRTKIYVMTHKKFDIPSDSMYLPMQVGRATHPNPELASYLGDDTGDSISEKNCYYSELTGLYWIWKNEKCADIVGCCHYRRYLLNHAGYMFRQDEIQTILKSYDIITTKRLDLNFSYYYGFGENHKIYYLDETMKVLDDLYPDYATTFRRLVQEKHTYFGNMMICKKELYDAYMEFLFGTLFELEKRITVEEEDSYHRRIFGFISEFLQYVWIVHRNLKVYECMVGMLGEKAETREVKQQLGRFFAKCDFEGAKNYFLECRQKRPDILMEASDVTGELHLCMQVIVTAGLEQRQYGTNLLSHTNQFEELMQYMNHLNAYHAQLAKDHVEPALQDWIDAHEISDVAHRISEQVMQASIDGHINISKI